MPFQENIHVYLYPKKPFYPLIDIHDFIDNLSAKYCMWWNLGKCQFSQGKFIPIDNSFTGHLITKQSCMLFFSPFYHFECIFQHNCYKKTLTPLRMLLSRFIISLVMLTTLGSIRCTLIMLRLLVTKKCYSTFTSGIFLSLCFLSV